MKKKFVKFNLKNIYIENELKEYNKNKNKIYNKKFQIDRKALNTNSNKMTIGGVIENIQKNILENIIEFKVKKEKDIFILIDFNVYNKYEDNLYTKTYKIDIYIEQTILILNNYLSAYDRFGVFIYTTEYNIICPLMLVNKIEINIFSKELFYYKNKIFNSNSEIYEYDINSNDFIDQDIEFNLTSDNNNEYYQEKSSETSEEEKNYNKIIGLINSINYLNKYSKMKNI